ncbi:MAG: hypothetical protein JNM93_11685 [Bacteriovoracaceae bacterium]|nr:hypothetical protein [Bacteriovoracaceae bacterium]
METVPTTIGQLNIVFGWVFIVLGILSGSVLGMWSFDGPMPAPKNHTNYVDLSRRLVRLAHIAMFMLPVINILYGMFIDSALLTPQLKQIGSISMIICMIGVPFFLILASFKNIFKYCEAVPVSAGILGLMLMAWGQFNLYLSY